MKKVEYINGLGEVYTFTKQSDSNVLMEGKFQVDDWIDIIYGEGEDWIKPNGGPMITKGQMLSHLLKDTDFNLIVEGFDFVESGYLIKTRKNEVDTNDFKHLEDRDIIGGII